MAKDKAKYVRAMFDAITPHYDLMNRLMTGGRDVAWRRMAAELTALPPAGQALDVAAGTADLALAIARRFSSAAVVAVDFSEAMLARGYAKAQGQSAGARIRFAAGDALSLPFPPNSFDAATSGFMMRNVIDIDRALQEQVRVVRPGGRVICLELSQPRGSLFRGMFWWYFTRVVPWVGRRISRHSEAYSYLPESLAMFISAEELQRRMEAAGLENVAFRRLMGGTVALHVGSKPAS